MFAVPGWSISSKELKTQTVQQPKPPEDAATDIKSSKKRKRKGGTTVTHTVDAANLGQLWERIIEGKKPVKPKKARHDRKRSRILADPDLHASTTTTEDAVPAKDNEKAREREKRRGSEDQFEKTVDTGSKSGMNSSKPTSKTSKPSQDIQLTPLQASMQQKLVSARFRHINETLYTTPSMQAHKLFDENPEMFKEYHEGFRKQVEVWPENPVDGYLLQIKQRGKHRGYLQRTDGDGPMKSGLMPLPRTGGTCHIADLGCGEAKISQGLQKDLKKLKLDIHSYDLQSPVPLVTKADIANLPLKDGSTDLVILCLALMGTNWMYFVEEAFRILRWKGELWIAETKSRFGRNSVKKSRVEHSVGNRKRPDKSTKKKLEEEEEADNRDLLVEVDGQESNRQDADVSAFVEVLRKRGFVLQNEKSVDSQNKMFVKMQFVKAVTPVKGKCAREPRGTEDTGVGIGKKPKLKFLDDDDPKASVDETSVLKPCLYKLR